MSPRTDDPRRKAVRAAAAVMSDKGQGSRLPTAIEALVDGEGVILEYFDSDRRFDGRIEMIKGRPAIFVNARHRPHSDGRTRFTLAHEIGHYYLHRGEIAQQGILSDVRIDPQADARNRLEFEANAFAGECLLPNDLLVREYGERVLGLTLIEEVHDRALVSLQMAAIGLMSLTEDCCCVLLEVDGRIKWACGSDDWRYRKLPTSSLKGTPLPRHAASALCPGDVGETEVDLVTWAPRQAWRDLKLFESALDTPYGRIILLGSERD